MKFAIDESQCVECGACRRYCPVGCIAYEQLQHTVRLTDCIGCVICYAVCPADAIIPVPDGSAAPRLTWPVVEQVRLRAFRRGPVRRPAETC